MTVGVEAMDWFASNEFIASCERWMLFMVDSVLFRVNEGGGYGGVAA